MLISMWCVVAIVALIIGGISSIVNKDRDDFGSAIFLVLFIGLGYLLTLGV